VGVFGEDAYLSSQMGAAMVAGFEGDDVNSKYHVASCMKHFIGYEVRQLEKTEP
jgi:beta-glucosidase